MRNYKFRLVDADSGKEENFVVQEHVFAGAARYAYMERVKKMQTSSGNWKIVALWEDEAISDG